MKKIYKSLAFALLILSSAYSYSANKTFTGPGNFSDPTKWNLGVLPVAGDNLAINGICTFDNAALNLAYGTLNVGSAVAGTLNWSAGSTNTINVTALSSSKAGSAINMTNGGVLQIQTSWVITNQTFTPGTGTVNWNVTGANSTIPSIATFNKLIITATPRVVSLGAATAASDIAITSGTLSVNSRNFTCTGTLSVSGTLLDNSTTGTNTINDLTVNSGGTFTCSAAAPWTINGNIQNNGTVTTSTGLYTLAGLGKTIGGTTAFKMGNVTCSGTYTNNTALTITTRLKITGTWNQSATSVLSLSITAANFTIGTFNASITGNVVNYSGAAAQNILLPSDGSYSNLTTSGGGIKALTGTTVINIRLQSQVLLLV